VNGPTEPMAFAFGKFKLIPAQRLLTQGGRSLKLGSRALDILVTLVQRAGEIVSRDELMSRVWSNVIVEDTNLRVHISTLRRVLEDDGLHNRYIVHVARRGYVFVAPLMAKSAATATSDTGAAANCLPEVRSERASEEFHAPALVPGCSLSVQ
jgi:DNA-binding winged helix-turn-helix (wHTH) protein